MIERFKRIVSDGIHETEFCFLFCNDVGMSETQVFEIEKILKIYWERYPKLELNKVCDYFSWDYASEAFTMDKYVHDKKSVLYCDRRELAQYNSADKLIGVNHIRLSKYKNDGDEFIAKVISYKEQLESAFDKMDKVKMRAKESGITDVESLFKMEDSDSELFKAHEINIDKFDRSYVDMMLIRFLEEAPFIKRIIIHEIAHAIADQYKVAEDFEVQRLYEEYKNGFENIDEFIAECFMASELVRKIPLANLVKERVDFCAN